jgi:HSP20 family molecular chaperone IbpA
LPRGVEQNAVSAGYTDGVLEVTIELPKKPEPARIAIQ